MAAHFLLLRGFPAAADNLEDILRMDRTLKIFPSDVYPVLRKHKLVRDCYFVRQLPHRPDGPDFPGGFSLDATKGLSGGPPLCIPCSNWRCTWASGTFTFLASITAISCPAKK
jgi:hypothetical protein